MTERKSQKGLLPKGLFAFFLCFGILASASFVALEARAEDEDAIVQFRKSLMQETKASLQSLSLLLKGKVADEKSLALQAQILALAAERAGEAFVFRTHGLSESTTAHERVWTEQKKFQALMKTFAEDAKAFSQTASSGASAKELGSAFGGLAKQCKSCHHRYRHEHDH